MSIPDRIGVFGLFLRSVDEPSWAIRGPFVRMGPAGASSGLRVSFRSLRYCPAT